MNDDDTHDLCVIGGGPAGSVAAIQAARKGHRVCLIEKSRFPRLRVGEALSPGVEMLLASIGLEGCLHRALFARSRETRIRWESEEVQSLIAPHPSFLVDRSMLDVQLLAQASQAGVEVVQPAMAYAIERDTNGWTIVGNGIEGGQLRTRTVIDAAGRSMWRTSRRTRWAPPTLGIWSAFAGELPVCLHLEAMVDGWLWAAPVAHERISVVFVTDPVMGAYASGRRPAALLRAQLRQSRLLRVLADAPYTMPVVTCDATASSCVSDVRTGFILAGEASITLDPLSGSGIEQALRSGIHAAAIIHTILQKPNRVELCERFLGDRRRETINSHLSWAGNAYASVARYAGEPFWASRARADMVKVGLQGIHGQALPLSGSVRLWLSPGVKFSTEACIEDGTITERQCMSGPPLERPVSFVDGVEIVPLLLCLDGSVCADSLLSIWSQRIELSRAKRVLDWLMQRQVLTVE